METSDWEDSPLAVPSEPPITEVPSVVAVVVTSDPDERFDAVLASLAAQDYPSLTVLVVDAGSGEDLSPRIGARLPDAFIRRLPEPAGFARAANEALAAVEGANYLLFVTDDVTLEPDVISLLVEEAYRSNAGVVSPKFVDADRREVLLEIGLAADKLGVPAAMVDAGEIDHEQHDAVRDVFAVPHAAMLVRADLCSALGGFDPDFAAGLEDVDLCWRARLAGARVLVVPDAVAARPWRVLSDFGPDPDQARFEEPTHRLEMLLRNYSFLSLARVLPQAALVTVVQAVVLAIMGRGRRSWAVVRAWLQAIRHLPSILGERRTVQAGRALPDRDIRSFQIRGFAYLRAFLAGQLDLGSRVDALSGAGRDFAHSFTLGFRRTPILVAVGLMLFVLLGSRELITETVPAVGSFLPWPEPMEAFREFTSGWRFTGAGSSAPAPPALAFMGALGTLTFGSAGLARTVVIVGAIPLGAYGAFRLMLPLARSAWPPMAAAVAYAVVPIPRNAIADAQLGSLVFYALAPFLVARILRAGGIEPFGVRTVDGQPLGRHRAVLSLAILTAVAAAAFPAALVLVPFAALMLVVASLLAGDRMSSITALVSALAAAGVALALLFPWSLSLLLPTPDLEALGFAFGGEARFNDLLLFDTGPARIGFAGLLLGVAAQPLLIGSGERLRWSVRAWMLAFGSWTAAWLPARTLADAGMPPAEGVLVLAALGVAMAVGLGSGVLREELQRSGLSWRQGVALASMAALVFVTFPFLADTFDGRWNLPGRDWSEALGWMESETSDGGFRVLWVGDPEVLPVDPIALDDGTGFGITRNGTGNATALWPPPSGAPSAHIEGSLESAIEGGTERLGRMLGVLGVRYIAFPTADGPGEVEPPEPDAAELRAPLERALSRQLDLAELTIDPGIRLYENTAWMPTGALVDGDLAAELAETEPADAVAIDLSGARPVPGMPHGPEGVRVDDDARDRVEGVLMFAEAFDDEWEAVVDGQRRPHLRTFGLVNGFEVEDVDRVSVSYGGQWFRYGALAVEAVIWALVLVAWNRRRTADRIARDSRRQSLHDVRPNREVTLEGVPT